VRNALPTSSARDELERSRGVRSSQTIFCIEPGVASGINNGHLACITPLSYLAVPG
jgi:hypothetical protein